MASENSVAPKERINIVYKPATDGVEEDVEISMKTLVVGEFTPENDPVALSDRKAINVNKDNFNDVLNGQNLKLNLNVENCLDQNNEDELKVSLEINKLFDFSPDSIVEQIPELKKLIELRGSLKALRSPLGNVPEFRRKLATIIENPETRAQLLDELNINPEQNN